LLALGFGLVIAGALYVAYVWPEHAPREVGDEAHPPASET
jgi:regulator of extracellular matrix RemA (YlzA/DUF370 family)